MFLVLEIIKNLFITRGSRVPHHYLRLARGKLTQNGMGSSLRPEKIFIKAGLSVEVFWKLGLS